MKLLFVGIGLVLIGLLPAVGLFLSFRQIRKTPKVLREYLTIPENDKVIHIVRPQIESRYEYRLSGVVVVGDNKPDHTFDFYLLHDMETLALYEQGKNMPPKRHQFARRVIDRQTFMQTGPGSDFALVFVNPHPYEIQVHVKLDHYPTPALLRGDKGCMLFVLAVVGLLTGLVGVIMVIVGVVQWLL